MNFVKSVIVFTIDVAKFDLLTYRLVATDAAILDSFFSKEPRSTFKVQKDPLLSKMMSVLKRSSNYAYTTNVE